MASQDGKPTSFDAASRSIVWYTDRICFGAATVSGIANRALISALSAGDSLDIVLTELAFSRECYRMTTMMFYLSWEVLRIILM